MNAVYDAGSPNFFRTLSAADTLISMQEVLVMISAKVLLLMLTQSLAIP